MADNEETPEHRTQGHGPAGGSPLTHKVGPLPVWGWAAVFIVSYLLYRYLKNRNAAAAATAAGTVTAPNGANSLIGTEGASVNGSGQIVDNATGTVLGTVQGSNGPGTPDTTTVGGWVTAAEQFLQNLGYDPNSAGGALQNYVAGQPLSNTQMGIIEAAIHGVGNAPSSLGSPISGGAEQLPTPSPDNPYSLEQLFGGGYGANPGSLDVTGYNGINYTGIVNPDIAFGLLKQGVTLYYQPTPGNFMPVTPQSNLPQGTPLFQQSQQPQAQAA